MDDHRKTGRQILKKDRWKDFKDLRRKAQRVFSDLESAKFPDQDLDPQKLLEELNIYHIELELQNEELLQTRDQLESSRKYLRNLFKLSPVGYLVLDTEGVITDINEAAGDCFDLKREVLVGSRLHAFIPHDHYVDFATSFRQVIEQEAVQQILVRFRIKSERQFWARLDLFQIAHPVEESPIILCAMVDISKEKDAEEVLHNAKEKLAAMVAEQTRELQKINRLLMAEKEMLLESERRFKETADLLPTVICELDLHQRVSYINDAGKALLGIDPLDGTADVSILSTVHPDDRTRAEHYFRQVLGPHPPEPEEFRLRTVNKGRDVVFLIKASVMRMNGVVVGSRCSLTDVTALKQMQNRVFQAQKMESMATLAGGIAHEFNNALTTVLGNVSLLEMAPPSSPVPSYLAAIKTAGEHMSNLTNHLLAYARGGKYMNRNLDVNALTRDILQIVRHHFANPFAIQSSLGENLPTVKGDESQIDMLLLILLTNASEACEDTQQVKITTRVREVSDHLAKLKTGMRAGRFVVISIEDEGCGMSQDTLSKIFEPFFTTKFQGRGLGMAAAYGIVKNHQGWIGVESEPGRGTMVEVYLPVTELPS
ncbi:MAG: PAS domain S-box protein [Desulfobacterales bacterium]|jgi:PAS domain S-box-containing protein